MSNPMLGAPKYGHLTVNDLHGLFMASIWVETREHEWTPQDRARLLYELFLKGFDCFVNLEGGLTEDVCKSYGYARFMLDHIGSQLSEQMTRVSDQAYLDAKNKQVKL